jgi:hypothetical protein
MLEILHSDPALVTINFGYHRFHQAVENIVLVLAL